MIAIIDYDAGNLRSVEKALAFLGHTSKITRDYKEILSADKVILPGVGAFEDAMKKLQHYGLVDVIGEVADKKTPLLGICLGLQLLFEHSEEANKEVKGLCLLEGEIVRIPDKEGLKIPHIGWNSIEIKPNATLFQGISNQSYVYFVHSYYLQAKHREDVAATTDYSTILDASVEKDNIFACQFHPEKSGEIGLKILNNFATL